MASLSRAAALVPAALLALAGLLVPVGPLAAAADNDPSGTGTVTWSVAPADADGPDGRSWVELELDPGESATEHLVVRNFGDETVTFAVDAADGYLTPTGRFSMLPSDVVSQDAGTWVDVAASVTVDAGGSTVLPFTVTVPVDATPGDHAAGVAAAVRSAGADADGTAVGVESRVGFRVMTRVPGELAPSLALTDVRATYTTRWNPFEPGSVEVRATTVDDGNTRLAVSTSARAQGRAATVGPEDGVELLPGDERPVDVVVDRVWPLGPVTVEMRATPTVLPDGRVLEPVVERVTVWALPWPQLLVVGGVALVLVGALARRRRRAAHLADLLDAARAEGERRARETASAPPG